MNADIPENFAAELEVIRKFCLDGSYKIAVAESATAGFVQLFLSNMNEAGLFYNGGVTAYTCEAKHHLLHIRLDKCYETNGVTPEIADLLAENCCVLFKANLGISLTGYASAIPEQGVFEKFAFISISLNGELILADRLVSDKTLQCEVQMDFACRAIRECARCLSSRTPRVT